MPTISSRPMVNYRCNSSKDMNIKCMVTLRPSVICVFHSKIGSERHSGRGARILIHLYKQATTTPKVRTAIQASAGGGGRSERRAFLGHSRCVE